MKILVLRFSSIGDIVLTTPIVRCMKQDIPNCEIHFVTKKSFASILAPNPHIDQLHTFEKSVNEIKESLKAEHFDVVIDLHNNIRTLKLKSYLKVKSYAFPKKNIAKLLLTTFKWNRLPKVHIVARYFEAVKPIGVKNDNLPCDFFLDDAAFVDLNTFGLVPKQFIAVAMGSQYETKQMPVSIMHASLKKVELPIVLLGGKMDKERSTALKAQLNGQTVIDFCGELSLNQSAFMCKNTAVLFTGDTGLMHIASCFETPIVSVWGNTVPDFGMYAYTPKDPLLASIHQVDGLNCRPCSKIGYHSCPKKHFNCMNMQNTSEIAAQLNLKSAKKD